MTQTNGQFEFIGHGITWIPDEQETKHKYHVTREEKLEIELEHYKRLVNNLQSEVSYYKNLFKPNNIENIVRPKACAYN